MFGVLTLISTTRLVGAAAALIKINSRSTIAKRASTARDAGRAALTVILIRQMTNYNGGCDNKLWAGRDLQLTCVKKGNNLNLKHAPVYSNLDLPFVTHENHRFWEFVFMVLSQLLFFATRPPSLGTPSSQTKTQLLYIICVYPKTSSYYCGFVAEQRFSECECARRGW